MTQKSKMEAYVLLHNCDTTNHTLIKGMATCKCVACTNINVHTVRYHHHVSQLYMLQ